MKVIQPTITYVMLVWGGVNEAEFFKTLERQHCRAARIIFGFPPDMPTVDVLATVKWNTSKGEFHGSAHVRAIT